MAAVFATAGIVGYMNATNEFNPGELTNLEAHVAFFSRAIPQGGIY
jgi:hypothetical protein